MSLRAHELPNTYNTSRRLLKTRLEKEELDGRLKDLQPSSALATKKPTAASDAPAEVIVQRAYRRRTVRPPMSDSCVIHPRSQELRHCRGDLKQARAALDRQRGELDEQRRALEALKAAGEEKEAELLAEISRLKRQAREDKAELEKAQEQAKEVECPTAAALTPPPPLPSSFVV